jgi:protein-disulfide isomerase/uncharacterized membrane protein
MDGQPDDALSTLPRVRRQVALLVVLALAGGWICWMLAGFHMSRGGGRGVFQLVCRTTGAGCERVLASSWSMLPGSVPTALAGLAYFATLALWYLLVGAARGRGRRWHLPVLLLQILAALLSILLLAVMLLQLRAACAWCLAAHAINLAMLVLAWRLWSAESRLVGERGWPPRRLGVAVLFLAVAVAALCLQTLGIVRLRRAVRAAGEEAERFRGDVDLLRYVFLRGRPVSIPLRPDDVVLGSSSAPHLVVVFSDFQCPACRSFAELFDRQVIPAFAGRLRLAYKHFPLDTECSPRLPRDFHPGACKAAYAAEAARQIGGAQAFRQMHQALFAQGRDGAHGGWSATARRAGVAGLDGVRLGERVAQGSGRDRVLEDVRLGYSLQLGEVPRVFLDGRRLEDWSNLDLWKLLLAAPAPVAPSTAESAPPAAATSR